MNKQKWKKIVDNYILDFDDWFVSYLGPRRPKTKQQSLIMDSLYGALMGEDVKQHTETALVKDSKFFILNGDFRKEYEKLGSKGWDACFKFYSKKREKHISQWSYDYFDRETNKQKIKQLISEIGDLLDAPSSDFQEEGERWETIVDFIEELAEEVKK